MDAETIELTLNINHSPDGTVIFCNVTSHELSHFSYNSHNFGKISLFLYEYVCLILLFYEYT
jgi:hypothetical protein